MAKEDREDGNFNGAVQGPSFGISGGGSYGRGILSGGATLSARFNAGNDAEVEAYAGGGGAVGSVKGEGGRKEKIREFEPEFGVSYRKRF